jgi:uncharacterized membrane protein
MLTDILINFIGSLVFLFIFWKKLKEDYSANTVFTCAFFVIFGLSGAVLASDYLIRPWWFWIALGGVALGLGLGIFKYKMRFYETLEAVIISLLPLLTLTFLNDSIKHSSVVSFLGFIVTTLLIVLYYFLDSHYKNFSWYKSGRVGLSGLVTLGVMFLLRAGIASFFPFVLSFQGRYEVYLSSVAAFTLFLLIFNLSRSEV